MAERGEGPSAVRHSRQLDSTVAERYARVHVLTLPFPSGGRNSRKVMKSKHFSIHPHVGCRQRETDIVKGWPVRRKGKVIKLAGNDTNWNKLPGRGAEVQSNTSDDTKRAKQKIMSLFIK